VKCHAIQTKIELLFLPVIYTVGSLAFKFVIKILRTETCLVCLGASATLHIKYKNDAIIINNCRVSGGGGDNSSTYYN
jgi:hypothetical protein